MAYNPDPRLVQAIRQNGGKLAPILLATALVESGGRLDAVGDGGRSHGPYQMYDLGRGHGVPISQRRDPVFSTKSAYAEFLRFYNRGARGADLAYRAQRPADRAGYMAKISAALPAAQQLLGAGAGPAVPPAAGTPAPGDLQQVSGSLDVRRLMGILNAQRQRTLSGQMPSPNYGKELQRLAQGALPRAQVKAAGQQVGAQVAGAAQAVGKSVPILPGQGQWGSFGYGDPEGQGGRHMAVDWFAKAGTPARAPLAGKIVRLTPDPTPGQKASGQVFGGTVAIRLDDGRLVVMRHITPGKLKVGQRVPAGAMVGTVKDWSGSPHIHLELYKKGSSDREYSAGMALNPRSLYT
jgi:murein DD-endopeptidase MepM/ murein hydrolase activator NlpD